MSQQLRRAQKTLPGRPLRRRAVAWERPGILACSSQDDRPRAHQTHRAGDGCTLTGAASDEPSTTHPCAWLLLPAGPSLAAAGHTVAMRLQHPSSAGCCLQFAGCSRHDIVIMRLQAPSSTRLPTLPPPLFILPSFLRFRAPRCPARLAAGAAASTASRRSAMSQYMSSVLS